MSIAYLARLRALLRKASTSRLTISFAFRSRYHRIPPPAETPMRCFFLLALVVFLPFGTVPSSADPNDKSAESTGWKSAAPRNEIQPLLAVHSKGGPNGPGALVTSADDRDGLHGWWQKSFPVTGGKHYRFHAVRKVHGVPLARRATVVRILWQDAAGKPVPTDEPAPVGYLKGWKGTAEPEHPADRETDDRGWTEVAETYRAPAKATQAVVELQLRWAPPKGRLEWADVSLSETS